jgi:uncharacterized protein
MESQDARSSTASPSSTPAAPTAPGERHEIIDIVRGFALFGVLLANMVWTTQWVALTAEQREALPTAGIDSVVGAAVNLLVDYKFYSLFSILFGLGFALQLSRATGRGQNVLPTYVRRLAILFAMGVAHAFLLWFGDILHTYALLGFVLILFRNRSDRVVFRWMLGIAGFTALLPALHWLTATLGNAAADVGADGPSAADRFEALSGGGWTGILAVNWGMIREMYTPSLVPDGCVHWYLNVLWRFLLGFLIGRRMLLQQAERHLGLFRRVLPWALVIGVAGNAFMAISPFLFDTWIGDESSALVLAWIPIEVGIIALALAYLCGLVLLYQRPGWRRVLGLLAPLGRMALTNYLTQTVLLVVVFYGVGFGLLGEVGVTGCVLLSVAIYGVQIVLSAWWLRQFRFGPVEWLWRCLTYGRLQPFRLASVESVSQK